MEQLEKSKPSDGGVSLIGVAIKKNEEIIKKKQELNKAIEDEYKLSAQKEEEIKEAFEKLKEKVKV